MWLDTGSGPGYVKEVRCDQLSLADIDDGKSSSAFYLLHPARDDTDGGAPLPRT
ncbi:hypothetical protein Q0Z83_037960 [Actinoplanes sichuanensis]|uniref:Uncharacterized protein n=1 Tax=Actinoplanes sichuanensis TaxID=512349 RepID=A0ABW4A2U4_9ACTN|nr:hypothetical protein [Actinoplanes sichuanensis]BEL05605.1 hypothetical protein Q0Z83_037960 [Actinoplanes sichuanensis]